MIHKKTGLHVNPKEQQELVEAIAYLSQDKDYCQTLGTQAQDHVLKNFNFKDTAAFFEQEFLSSVYSCEGYLLS